MDGMGSVIYKKMLRMHCADNGNPVYICVYLGYLLVFGVFFFGRCSKHLNSSGSPKTEKYEYEWPLDDVWWMMEEIPDVWTVFGKIIIYTWNLKDLMSGQPTPP